MRQAFRRAVTRKRETWGTLAERVGTPRVWLEQYNGRLVTVARGKQRGRLVAGQVVRVPTDAVLAYARDVVSDGDDGPGTLPALAPSTAEARGSDPPRASAVRHRLRIAKEAVAKVKPGRETPASKPTPKPARRHRSKRASAD